MKRKVLILLTVILSIFIGISSVRGEEFSGGGRGFGTYDVPELTCIYKGSIIDIKHAVMLFQDSNGTINIYTNDKTEPDIDDSGLNYDFADWESVNSIKYEFDSIYYQDGYLTECPAYERYTSTWTGDYTFYFYDDKTKGFDYDLIYSSSSSPDSSNGQASFSDDDEVPNKNWIGECTYSNVILYFDNEEFFLEHTNAGSYAILNAMFSHNDLMQYYNSVGVCPPRLYYKNINCISTLGKTVCTYNYYLSKETGTTELPNLKCLINGESCDNIVVPSLPDPGDYNTCKDLFSDEFIEKLNSYLKWLRILAPILVIFFGTMDFVRAIFSANDEDIKKAQKRFVIRLVAAVVIFFIPTIINLLLKIANSVWGNIDSNSCNIG